MKRKSTTRFRILREETAAFCQRWRITDLALFGPVLRDDFCPDSDIDVLVTFARMSAGAFSMLFGWRKSWQSCSYTVLP